MSVNKFAIEAALHAEKQEIQAGRLKEDNPLDNSEDFRVFCEACRRGDLKVCQEKITEGVNINARDRFDYTPLILASLCGHFEVVRLLLESGALCERDTFQGERCLYNALNDRIRNLLLSYDYSKSTDPLQPLAAHITSLLNRDHPKTSDITLVTADAEFHLHKWILAARSPYFRKKLDAAPETTVWKLSASIPTQSFEVAIRYLYLGEVSADLGEGEEEQAILLGIDKLSRQLEIERLFESILEGGDRRLARQRRTEEVERGRNQLDAWFKDNVLRHKIEVRTEKAQEVKWDSNNGIFADVLLQADEEKEEDTAATSVTPKNRTTEGPLNGIPIGPISSTNTSRSPSATRKSQNSILFPAHKAILLRSDFFNAMFSSAFKEAQETPHLQIIPIACSPAVLEVVLTYLYTEHADFSLELAVDVLFAADLLFIDKLKQRAAVIISTLGNGAASIVESENPRGETDAEDVVDIYEIVRAGWDTRVHRLEEYGARFIAYRLERYIDEPEFSELVRESAARIKTREETDTVELVDEYVVPSLFRGRLYTDYSRSIRYYLSERFRLRFEDAGLDEMLDENPSDDLPRSDLDKSNDPGSVPFDDEAVDVHSGTTPPDDSFAPDLENLEGGVVRTLDGDIAGDEFSQDAMNYQILLGKIDRLLDGLRLDA
ncbi:hypothetical protein LTR66_002480 [Elasticomyces elasticus]|nr:hypothetical protein LTR66_002480 [Elasticomyces elasticus]